MIIIDVKNMIGQAKVLLLSDYVIDEKNLKGEQHDGFSFVFHGMAAKPPVVDRCRFCGSIHLSKAIHSAGKVEKTIDFETKKHKEQKAQKQKAQAIGVSICCNQKIKAS